MLYFQRGDVWDSCRPSLDPMLPATTTRVAPIHRKATKPAVVSGARMDPASIQQLDPGPSQFAIKMASLLVYAPKYNTFLHILCGTWVHVQPQTLICLEWEHQFQSHWIWDTHGYPDP